MQFTESETVELKREYTADVKKTVVAFANSLGGVIVIGVEDTGEVCGVADPALVEQQLSSMLHDAIKPDVTMFTSISRNEVEGKQVLELAVQRGTDRPYYLVEKGLKPSGVYIRLGNASIPATEAAIRNMIIETDGTRYEEIRSLDQSLTFDYAAGVFFAQRGVEFTRAHMRTLGIIGSDNLYTNLGLLISDQCLHSVKIAVFAGADKSVFHDRREFGGSVLKQLADAYQYIDLNNRTKTTFSGLTRIDARDYDEAAIREALLNAIVHRDYSYSGSVLVNIYNDRMEFVSIGGLVPGLTMNDIMLGISQPRNERLAGIFYRLHFIEAYGTGIGRIRNAYEGSGLTPVFSATDNAFRVILPNKNLHLEGLSIREQPYLANRSSELESSVRRLLAEHGTITRRLLQEQLGLKQTKAGLLLRELEAKGALVRTGDGRNTAYHAPGMKHSPAQTTPR